MDAIYLLNDCVLLLVVIVFSARLSVKKRNYIFASVTLLYVISMILGMFSVSFNLFGMDINMREYLAMSLIASSIIGILQATLSEKPNNK